MQARYISFIIIAVFFLLDENLVACFAENAIEQCQQSMPKVYCYSHHLHDSRCFVPHRTNDSVRDTLEYDGLLH